MLLPNALLPLQPRLPPRYASAAATAVEAIFGGDGSAYAAAVQLVGRALGTTAPRWGSRRQRPRRCCCLALLLWTRPLLGAAAATATQATHRARSATASGTLARRGPRRSAALRRSRRCAAGTGQIYPRRIWISCRRRGPTRPISPTFPVHHSCPACARRGAHRRSCPPARVTPGLKCVPKRPRLAAHHPPPGRIDAEGCWAVAHAPPGQDRGLAEAMTGAFAAARLPRKKTSTI